MTPRSLRKTFLGWKSGKRLREDLYLKKAEKEFTIISKGSKKQEVRGLDLGQNLSKV